MGAEDADAIPAGKGRSPYREQYSAYATRFGSSERTIKRWVSDGVSAADPCPLDEPVALRAWWGRHKRQRVPEEILRAAASIEPLLELPDQTTTREAEAAADPDSPASPSPLREKPATPRVLGDYNPDDIGIQVILRRAQERAWQAHHGWTSATTEEDAVYWERRCSAADEAVRKISKDATEEQIRLRDYIPRLPAEAQLAEFHMALVTRWRGQAEDMARALGIPLTPAIEERWNAAVDLLCESLQAEIFTEETEEPE